MQVMNSSLPLSPRFTKYTDNGFSDFVGDFTHDFGVKLQLEISDERNQEQEEKLSNRPVMEDYEEENEDEEEDEDEEEEFSFVCLKPDGSPISADDVFQNGQIRPVFPLFNRDLILADEVSSVLKSDEGDVISLRPPLTKLFVEDSSETTTSTSDPAGPYCEWRRDGRTVKEASPETCKKSNSTGFSKLWRVRDLMHRSSSDGKDAFVFLNHPPRSSVKNEKKNEKQDKVKETAAEKPTAKKERSGKTASLSAHEKYIKNRAMREGDKRRSYLPYRQIGFFTNVNGLSRNVHPF